MSDRSKSGWSTAGVIALLMLVVSASGAVIKASFYLGTIAQDVGHVRSSVDRIEKEFKDRFDTLDRRVSSLERMRNLR